MRGCDGTVASDGYDFFDRRCQGTAVAIPRVLVAAVAAAHTAADFLAPRIPSRSSLASCFSPTAAAGPVAAVRLPSAEGGSAGWDVVAVLASGALASRSCTRNGLVGN